ncbi:DUF1353 domain-containing protein [Palleronia sp. LCG004]|uniref:DUF1353 domain-containing protein n=1 Tax=Palleronia sp. LCG004 TaxID=3079304 RepID=UPI0029436636|nr:DUF1353 domain-containing protein [Palleronia sp. LCG004]WOI56545.1 DUF1353 domain-containing protein [Palleronia sp. LCG004]
MRLDPPKRPATNPYPDDWTQLTEFEYLSPLSLIRPVNNLVDRLGADGDYVLQHDFDCALHVDGELHVLTAPRGLVTDLTSVPPVFRLVVGRVGPWLEAAILHDYLYVAWAFLDRRGPRPNDRLFADRVMLLAMEAAGVRRWRRRIIYLALRWFGARSYGRADPETSFADLDAEELDPALIVPDAPGQSGTLSMPDPPSG